MNFLTIKIKILNLFMIKERKDEIINEKDEISNKNDLYYLQWENFSLQTKFLYTPHRICSAFILLFCLLYFWPTTETGKFVMIMCISTFVLSIFLQDGPLIRPHPFFWRIILALVIFLILNIVFLCTVEREEIIKYISKMTPGKAGNITNDRDMFRVVDKLRYIQCFKSLMILLNNINLFNIGVLQSFLILWYFIK